MEGLVGSVQLGTFAVFNLCQGQSWSKNSKNHTAFILHYHLSHKRHSIAEIFKVSIFYYFTFFVKMLYKSEEKKVWASQKPLSEGYINGYHLFKKIRLIRSESWSWCARNARGQRRLLHQMERFNIPASSYVDCYLIGSVTFLWLGLSVGLIGLVGEWVGLFVIILPEYLSNNYSFITCHLHIIAKNT